MRRETMGEFQLTEYFGNTNILKWKEEKEFTENKK